MNYLNQSYFSDPGRYAYLYNELSSGIPEITSIVQNLMVHPMEAELYDLKLSSSRVKEEEQLRTTEQILEAVIRINPDPLKLTRDNKDKIIGICRDHVLLLISMLRFKGFPARARVGFASYFDSKIENEWHWIAEYYDRSQNKWIQIDPQIDDLQKEKHKIRINPQDLPRGVFYTAGRAWKEAVSGKKKPEDFGFNKKWRGWSTIKSSVIQDFLCLNSIEPLAWDLWGKITEKEYSKLNKEDHNLLNEIVSFTSLEKIDPIAISNLYNRIDLKKEVENSMRLVSLNKRPLDISENLKPSILEIINKNDIQDEFKKVKSSETAAPFKDNEIIITGARQNNLKNIDIRIPKNKFTVITGVSGSGKSSLAFDTVYAEGRRRYMASLSAYARRFVDNMEKPDLDHIAGVLPAIAIEQKTLSRNPRSTVGTISEVYDYLRVLYSQLGVAHCPICGEAIEAVSSVSLAKNLIDQGHITLVEAGGETVKLDHVNEKELVDILDRGFRDGHGKLEIKLDQRSYTVSKDLKCSKCDFEIDKIEPGMFNQNSIDGSCPECSGLGEKLEVDPGKIIESPEKSLLDGASSWFGILRKKKKNANWMVGEMYALAEYHKVDLEKSWNDYPETFKSEVLFGNNGTILEWEYTMGKADRKGSISRAATGAVYNINRLFRGTTSEEGRQKLYRYMKRIPCSVCKGEKIGPVARLVTLGRKRYPEVACMTIEEVRTWMKLLKLNDSRTVRDLITDLENRLDFLLNVGLHYLTLDRSAPSLSGGEGQRIRLATQLGSGLSGILYVLDEPSIGLHPRDFRPLIHSIKELGDSGNTVLVVEHNRDTMLAADHIIDIGPGAGVNGGYVVSQGSSEEIKNDINSITGSFLNDIKGVKERRFRSLGNKWIRLKGASLNNLKRVDLAIPIGNFVGISGVSGSGKSSLISKTLVPAIEKTLSGKCLPPDSYTELSGIENIDAIINVTQAPIGRTPKSNPATYIDILDPIREIFAETSDAKRLKLDKKYFSFNSKYGACAECGGLGKKKVEMSFMPDSYSVCPDCQGARYNRKALQVKWKGHTISDILSMDINEAEILFREDPGIDIMLKTLQNVGLGYIKLGQNALTFSGGEAQRIKLARELCKKQNGRNVYILDEPTTGLHFADVKKLIVLLQKLTDAGNTVVVIEHNMDLLGSTDWIIDMGPDGGDEGGYIIAEGTPEEIAELNSSSTGKYLKSII